MQIKNMTLNIMITMIMENTTLTQEEIMNLSFGQIEELIAQIRFCFQVQENLTNIVKKYRKELTKE